jgi:hypothetical protein
MPFDRWRVIVTLWLLALAVIDLRRRALPHTLTTGPLLVMGSWFSIRAIAPIIGVSALAPHCVLCSAGVPDKNWDDVAVLLAFTAVLLSDTWLAGLPAFAAIGTAFVLGTGVGQVIILAWLVALAMNKAGMMGEGDAKTVMILMALYPDARLAAALMIAITVVGVTLMLIQLRTAMPLWLLSIARDLLTLKVPSRTGEAGTLNVPLMPLLTLGTLIYLWIVI